VAPFSLLEFARIGGKETLIPAIPVTSAGRATREISISALFTAGNILEDSYKEEFIDYGDATQDLIATVIYRETESQDVFPRNSSVLVSLKDTNEDDAIRTTFDASQFITEKCQAILFGRLLCNQRRWIRRGVEFKTFPTDSPVSPGSYIYVDIGLVSWDAITSGLIMEGGALNAPLTPQIANGTYSVLVYKDGEVVRSFDNITVTNGVASQLASSNGYLFVLGAKADRKRVFRVTEVQMDEEGEVTVKAVDHPCDIVDGTLLSKVANFSNTLFKGDEFTCAATGGGSPQITGFYSPTGVSFVRARGPVIVALNDGCAEQEFDGGTVDALGQAIVGLQGIRTVIKLFPTGLSECGGGFQISVEAFGQYEFAQQVPPQWLTINGISGGFEFFTYLKWGGPITVTTTEADAISADFDFPIEYIPF
jgi:hypothetical protein